MKYLRFICRRHLLFLAVVFMAFSCEKKGVYTNFETEYTFQVTVPGNSFLNLPIELFSTERESNASAQYEINDTRKDLVEEVFLKEFFIETVSPQGEDLRFLKSAAFYIDADEEPELKIAEKDPVPDNIGDELSFDIFNANMANYIKKEPFEIRANVVTREDRNDDITIKGTARFDVRAKVIGF